MAVLTNAGRAEVARILRERYLAEPRSFLLGAGNGLDWWGTAQAEVLAFDTGNDVHASRAPIRNPVLTSSDGVTVHRIDVDYAVDLQSGRITRIDGGAIEAGATVRLTYTARVPEPDLGQTELVGEVGRMAPTGLDYVLPIGEVENGDPAVSVHIGNELFAIVQHPTRMLLARARLNPGDAAGEPIRTYGLFMSCEVASHLPPGQQFFLPDEVTGKGVLALVAHIEAVPHSGSSGLDLSVVFEI